MTDNANGFEKTKKRNKFEGCISHLSFKYSTSMLVTTLQPKKLFSCSIFVSLSYVEHESSRSRTYSSNYHPQPLWSPGLQVSNAVVFNYLLFSVSLSWVISSLKCERWFDQKSFLYQFEDYAVNTIENIKMIKIQTKLILKLLVRSLCPFLRRVGLGFLQTNL